MPKTPVMYNSSDVFAAACAAQRINNDYFREPKVSVNPETGQTTTYESNKRLMNQLLTSKSDLIIEDDRVYAEAIRNYFQSKLMEVLADTATQYTKIAVSLSSKEQVAANAWYDLAVIASLPHSYKRSIKYDQQREAEEAKILASQHFGQLKDRVTGKLEVFGCKYSFKWNKWYISAVFNNNTVLFSYKDQLLHNKTYQFSGTVKSHLENNVTQLNRVKIYDQDESQSS